jgi:uncharacterized protein (DUF488 family)
VAIYSVGHSTRSLEELLGLLDEHRIAVLADVRTAPGSRRLPQFGRASLASELPAHGVAYVHLPELGGFRRPRPDSRNTAWRNGSFRGYADYMETPEFRAGVERLLGLLDGVGMPFGPPPAPSAPPPPVKGGGHGPPPAPSAPPPPVKGGGLAVMCAEAVPWRCHRSLISDALLARGVAVQHILGAGHTQPHRLTTFARVDGVDTWYPGPDTLRLDG